MMQRRQITLAFLMVLMVAVQTQSTNQNGQLVSDCDLGPIKATCVNLPDGKRLSISCPSDEKPLDLSYESIEDYNFSTLMTEFVVENCTGKGVIVDDDVLLHFPNLRKVVFNNISNLTILEKGLQLVQPGMVEFCNVKSLTLHPDSISMMGDSISNITLVNTNLRSVANGRNGKDISVTDATCKCNCQGLYWITSSEAESVMKRAVKCTVVKDLVKKNNCVMPDEDNTASKSFSVCFSMIFMVVVCLIL